MPAYPQTKDSERPRSPSTRNSENCPPVPLPTIGIATSTARTSANPTQNHREFPMVFGPSSRFRRRAMAAGPNGYLRRAIRPPSTIPLAHGPNAVDEAGDPAGQESQGEHRSPQQGDPAGELAELVREHGVDGTEQQARQRRADDDAGAADDDRDERLDEELVADRRLHGQQRREQRAGEAGQPGADGERVHVRPLSVDTEGSGRLFILHRRTHACPEDRLREQDVNQR